MNKETERRTKELSTLPVPDIVYHASNQAGLKALIPCKSTHRQSWVYATTDIAFSAIFLYDGAGDLCCSSGLSNGGPYIYERWRGAFYDAYSGKQGAIYELSGKTFQRSSLLVPVEVISEVAVPVLREIVIVDAMSYLIDLQDEGKIQIFLHDQRPSWIPDDDQDLVDRMVRWTKENPGSDWLTYAEKHHPHLLNRIRQGLSANENEQVNRPGLCKN